MAATEMMGRAFWLSNTGQFFHFDGAVPQILDCGIRRDVVDHLAPKQQDKVACYTNTLFNEIWWTYPDSRDGTETSRYVAVNPDEQGNWTSGTFKRSYFIPAGIYENPIGFSTDGGIYFHEIGMTADGSVLTGFLETSYFDIEDGNNLMILRRFVPDFEDLVGSVNLSIYSRLFPTDPTVTSGPYMITPTTRKVDFRHTGRQIKVRFDFAASPVSWRLGVCRFDSDKSGSLR
jgi:hypothetical protein